LIVLLLLLLLFIFFLVLFFGNVITPVQPEVSGTEGDNITLSCNYSSAVSLQWYRQYPNSAPEFLLTVLHRTGKVSQTSKIVDLDPRFSGKVTEKKTHVDLEISSVKMKDSALYYCALEPTVTGNTTTLYKNLTYVTHPVGSLLIIQEISADICLIVSENACCLYIKSKERKQCKSGSNIFAIIFQNKHAVLSSNRRGQHNLMSCFTRISLMLTLDDLEVLSAFNFKH
uniref:T-cell receptor alpha/delta variable 25.0.4 n=1 Tax=Cyprinus carpio carpio TaxID=630221 RepID=A0A8C0YGD7_CYPCA